MVTSCPVLQSVDLTDVRDFVTYLFGDGEEAKSLRPFVMVAVRENVHFRLPLKRIYDGVSKFWCVPSSHLSQELSAIRHLQLQCDRVVQHEGQPPPTSFCELQSIRDCFPNLWTLTLHITLFLCGSIASEYFYCEASRLLDVISATCPGKEKFARVRGEEDCGHTWYLPLVKIDSRRGKAILTEAKEELPEHFR